MISNDLNNSINYYIVENNISIKINEESNNNELDNNINSDQIVIDKENKINGIENYNDNNNTNFNFEETLNKNEIIDFYDFNDKYFNPKFFSGLSPIDNENSNFYLNQEYDEVYEHLEEHNSVL